MHVFPLGIFQRSCPPELEETVKRHQRNCRQTQQSAGVETHREIDGFGGNIDRAVAGEFDGSRGGLEVADFGDAFLNREVAESGFGALVTEPFVIHHFGSDRGERSENRHGKEFAILHRDESLTIHRGDIALRDVELDATGDVAARFHVQLVSVGEFQHIQLRPGKFSRQFVSGQI